MAQGNYSDYFKKRAQSWQLPSTYLPIEKRPIPTGQSAEKVHLKRDRIIAQRLEKSNSSQHSAEGSVDFKTPAKKAYSSFLVDGIQTPLKGVMRNQQTASTLSQHLIQLSDVRASS